MKKKIFEATRQENKENVRCELKMPPMNRKTDSGA